MIRIRHIDPIVHGQRTVIHSEDNFLRARQERNALVLGWALAGLNRQVVGTQHDVLRRREDWLTGGRREDVGGRHHQELTLHDCFQRKRHMNGHLVTIEVGVVSRANEGVNADGFTFDQDRLESLNGETVKGRRPIQQNRMSLGDFLDDIPNFRGLLLDHLARTANGVHKAKFLEATNDERLEQDEGHLLRQSALVELQLRTDDDHGTTRIIDALAEEILAETTLLALEHVGQGLQRAIAGAGNRTTVTTIVEQGINRLL